ncbi:MAG: hypothetical protein H6581_31095 [Bacteroidia bacterium]|nr:hypothetical protein [Bacteroidia bacterium]
MPRSLENVIKIALTGASIALDAREYSLEDLCQIAGVYAAFSSIRNEPHLGINFHSHLSLEDLESIAQAGKGKVLFSTLNQTPN